MHQRKESNGDTKIDIKEETTYTSSQEALQRAKEDSILKRIPTNSEATTVLVRIQSLHCRQSPH